jgi:exopolyphosphatase/guanosine-5'-triphosphate,3'-diphosphate pyrophosphatase
MEKIAIIDLGSNSARLVIVRILKGGYFVVIDELKEPVRLAKDMETDGFLRPLRVAQTIKTLRTFRTLYESHGVSKVFAYATAVVRRAKNKQSFIDEVANTCGIKLTVISQEDEATLVYRAVINSMDVPKGLIIDIGGGSIKLIHYNRRVMIAQDTLPFGAVTLTEKFSGTSNDPEDIANNIEKYVEEEIRKLPWIKDIEPDVQLIGVGGSLRNLGRISRRIRKYPLNMAHNYHIPFGELQTIYNTIKPLDAEKLAKIKGLSSVRADIFPAALSALQALINCTNFNELIIGGAGFREGAMFTYAVPQTIEKPISDVVGHGIYTMLSQFNMNIPHAEHVFDLSLQLYHQLRVLHKLPRRYVKILRVAAMLHDIGSSLKFYDHHKHTAYFILNSNLYGISQKDLIISAFVAASHTKDGLDIEDLRPYADLLNEEELDAIRKLGVIVRIAECFDRSMGRVIVEINCDVLGDSVILKMETKGDCTLEIKDAMGALPEFRRAFKKNLDIL